MNKENFIGLGIAIGIIFLVVGLVSIILFLDNKRCLSAYENFQPEWGIWTRCRIVVDGKLTPVDIVRELK